MTSISPFGPVNLRENACFPCNNSFGNRKRVWPLGFRGFRFVPRCFPFVPNISWEFISRDVFRVFPPPFSPSLRFFTPPFSPIRSDFSIPTVFTLPCESTTPSRVFPPACRTVMSPGLLAFPSVGLGVLGKGFSADLGFGGSRRIWVGGSRRIWGLGLGDSRWI